MQFGGDPNCDQADLNLRGRALKGRNLRGRIRGHWSDVIRAVFGLWPSRLMGFMVLRGPSVEPATDAYIKWRCGTLMWLIASAPSLGFACVANSHLHSPPTVLSDLAVRRTMFLLHAWIPLEVAHLRRSGEPVRGNRRPAVRGRSDEEETIHADALPQLFFRCTALRV